MGVGEYWAEYLYRKRTGEFFLHGTGGPGPMSRYSRKTGQNQWVGWAEIRPLSLREAQKMADMVASKILEARPA